MVKDCTSEQIKPFINPSVSVWHVTVVTLKAGAALKLRMKLSADTITTVYNQNCQLPIIIVVFRLFHKNWNITLKKCSIAKINVFIPITGRFYSILWGVVCMCVHWNTGIIHWMYIFFFPVFPKSWMIKISKSAKNGEYFFLNSCLEVKKCSNDTKNWLGAAWRTHVLILLRYEFNEGKLDAQEASFWRMCVLDFLRAQKLLLISAL